VPVVIDLGGRPLETERLRLEPWKERHREAWRLVCRDPEVMRFIGPGEVWDTEKADEVFDAALAHWQEHGFGWRSALDCSTGDWLGFVGLNHVGEGVAAVAAEEVEIGWWIVRSAWGRGYASEGAFALRDEGFGRFGLNHIIARLQPGNWPSSRVARRIGMKLEREGIGRSGEPLHIYALDRARWEELRELGETADA
jgi:RimJ/RimL family protein N-acetyltransferase